ncbi:TolC family protein [Hymenobacter sp. HDW8]|uniref:TolC family protein n=1 Tax=Hymenobacter sp. HDW8 TaxID=2714932 RepID=UPI001409A26D|nr:TolC family protein [Hymenobacter sp. HDW8]QIL78187.1 TolC family protein [Hymenobacter sp. HDW8]
MINAMPRLLCILLLGAALSGPAPVRAQVQAPAAPTLSLAQVLAGVEASYPSLTAYQRRIQALDARAAGARSQMPPQVGFGLAQYPYRTAILKEMDSPENQAGMVVSVEQMLTNPAKLNARRDLLRAQGQVVRAEQRGQLNELRAGAKAAYYQRFVAERKRRVLSQSRRTLQRVVALTRDRYTYNQAALGTLFKAEAQLKELDNTDATLLSLIREGSIVLNTLLGQPTDRAFALDTAQLLRPDFADTTVARRSDLAAGERMIEATRLEQKIARLGRKPDFGVRFEHMQMTPGMANRYTLMGMVTVPIAPWSARLYRSEEQAVALQLDEQQLMQQALRLQAHRAVAEKRSQLRAGHEQLHNYETAILPAYRRAFEVQNLAYGQTTGNLFVLLDAWQMLLMKQMDYWDTYGQVLALQAAYDYETEQ